MTETQKNRERIRIVESLIAFYGKETTLEDALIKIKGARVEPIEDEKTKEE